MCRTESNERSWRFIYNSSLENVAVCVLQSRDREAGDNYRGAS